MTAELPSPPNLSLATTLDRVAFALDDLGKIISEVETCILDEIAPARAPKPVPPTIQQLDLALQMTDELARLIRRLARSETTHAAQTELATVLPIGLEKLRNLIAFGTRQEENLTEQTGHEQISLF